MKRMTILLIVFLLLFSISTGYAADYSSMTDEQLKEQFNAIRNELLIRGYKAENKTIILEQAGIQIYINGVPTVESSWSGPYLSIPIVIINNTNKNITFITRNPSVNGWTSDASIDNNEVPAGKKSKTEIQFELDATDVESINDFEDAEIAFTVYDKDNWFGEKVIEQTSAITIYANK